MSETNPLVLVDNLKSTLKRYVTTTLPVSRRYPELRQEIQKMVASQPLVKGPFVEGLPDFEKGELLSKLLKQNGGFLHDEFQNLPDDILNRPLHLHQEKALTAACKNNESLLVATGTGSGKTECFLYPIAHKLLNDPHPEEPGVRVLLVYPMNALANDQLYYRIAPLFGNFLRSANITFGRYTSQIKANSMRLDEEGKLKDNDKLMDALGGRIPENWLLTREEMLKTPPQILVTNYAMLEHLLLLPRNAPLFHIDKLHTVILDELHTYAGAQATEVAFLLRKLKIRLKSDTDLQVFGTSASLASGDGADAALIEFGSNLFGEPIQQVIRGKRIPHQRLQNASVSFSLTPQEWDDIDGLLNLTLEESLDVKEWNDELEDLGLDKKVPLLDTGLDLPKALEKVFHKNKEVQCVADVLDAGGVIQFEQLAKAVFPEKSIDNSLKSAALNSVMHLGMMARISPDSFPLLPSRYHIATNSIEGISVKLSSNHPEGWSNLQPFRTYSEKGKPYFSLLVCRRCGQPYIEAFSDKERLFNLRKDSISENQIKRKVFWLGSPAKYQVQDEMDEDASSVEVKNDKDKPSVLFINPKSGQILSAESDVSPKIALYEIATVTDDVEKNDYVRTCKACGSRATGSMAEIITPMQAGNEALGAVVTQQVLEALPPVMDTNQAKPMQGRSLLAFSDSRQNAAYFAPYFQRTGGDLALRTAIAQVVKEEDEPLGFKDLAYLILRYWRKFGKPVLLDANGELLQGSKTIQMEQVIGQSAAEFCTPGGRRNSLEALGLVRMILEKRKLKRFVREVAIILPESLKKQAVQLSHILLENIRREKAITRLAEVDMEDPHIWGETYARHRSFEIYKADTNASHGWIPQEGRVQHNRRTWYLVEQLGLSWEEARNLLGAIWEILLDQQILVSMNPGYGIDADLLRVISGAQQVLFYCQDCGLLLFDAIDEKCTAFRCKGNVVAFTEEERQQFHKENHYIYSVEKGGALTVRANEHTASLSTDLRQKIEQEFSEKKINLLSCTTTMEMGVDLGDLEAVINLNIPPGISNYQQRTGRAGRRAQAAPFCVTIARNGQYDQAVFREFAEYLEQLPPIPKIHLDNAKLFQRHQNSIILSGFLKHRIKDLSVNAPSLADLFGSSFGEKDYRKFIDAMNSWLEQEDGQLSLAEATKLGSRIPEGIRMGLALHGESLKNYFIEQLTVFASVVHGRWSIYESKTADYMQQNELPQAARWQSMQKKYMGQFLVTQLSSNGLIPTYSFPVNSLTLDVTKEFKSGGRFSGQGDVSLSRDAMLGVSEYAPGGEVIANGRLWTSAGLAYFPRDFMPTRFYVACQECHHIEVGEEKEDLGGPCEFCANDSNRQIRSFIEPRGFVTAYKDRKGKDPAQHRARKQYADEARLISMARSDQFIQTDNPIISKALLRSHAVDPDEPVGTLFVVNRGRNRVGFHRCGWCNYMEPASKMARVDSKHSELLGSQTCNNQHLDWPVDLAHIFNTDVCLLRFTQEIPPPEKGMSRPKEISRYYESFARTMNEALRFASTGLMGLQAGVVRSSHKLGQRYLTTVLYDSVPGGAGYAVRIFNELSINKILEAAILRLDCPNKCATACRHCLYDYSNQFSWDYFDRKPVLNWLRKLLSHTVEHPIINQGGMLWENPNFAGLTEQLATFKEIHIAGKTLMSNDSKTDSPIVSWLIGMLNQDYKFFVHLENELPSLTQLSQQQRMVLALLKPYIEQGKLVISQLAEKITAPIPRVFATPELKSPIWFSDYPIPALFDELLPQPIYRLYSNDAFVEAAKFLLSKSAPHTLDEIFPPEYQMQRWALGKNQPRNFQEYLAPVKDAWAEKITIKDPYCGADRYHIDSLQKLLHELKTELQQVESIFVMCKEMHHQDANHKPASEVQKSIQAAIKEVFDTQVNVRVLSFQQGKTFHDRMLEISCINEEGLSHKHLYDLSGGIDKLMDSSQETILFYSTDKK